MNCSLFNPTPSLSAMIVNHFKMKSSVVSYNLSGMGCSAGVISISLAKELLQVGVMSQGRERMGSTAAACDHNQTALPRSPALCVKAAKAGAAALRQLRPLRGFGDFTLD